MTGRRVLVVVMVAALLGAPACSRSGRDDDGFRLEVDGVAEVARGGEVEELDDGGHRVAAGDVVRMVEGDAVLELPGEREVLLRALDGDATAVRVAATPEVLEGDAVVVAGDGLRFTAGDVDVELSDGAAARVQRSSSVTVAMYDGDAELGAAGRPFDGGLRTFRQVSVPATGVLPRDAVPLVYDEDDPDPWDLRFLGDAIDLGAELEQQSRGFTGQLGPGARADATLLRRVLPELDGLDDLDALVARRPRTPGESLVGAAIVVESGVGRDRWEDVFAFREAGAAWGLVALDQAVQRRALLDLISGAFGRSPLLFAVGPATGGGATSTTATTSTTEPADGGGGGGGGDDPDPPPSTTVPPLTVPPLDIPEVTVPPEPDADGAVVDVIEEIVDEVLETIIDPDGVPLP